MTKFLDNGKLSLSVGHNERRANEMTAAAAAAEYRANVGRDFAPAEAYDSDYIDTNDVEDVDLMSAGERLALNQAMAEWYGID